MSRIRYWPGRFVRVSNIERSLHGARQKKLKVKYESMICRKIGCNDYESMICRKIGCATIVNR